MNFIENESSQKLRGGYYTPNDLAGFLVRWIKPINPTSILEPSCGDGAFLRAAESVRGFGKARFAAFELDRGEARKAKRAAAAAGLHATIRPEDFLGWALKYLNGAMKFNDVEFD